MKENSIEEDIKILENMNDGYTFKDCDICNNYNEKTKHCDKHKCMELQAIEHILSDYKRVLKENKELKKFITEGITIEPNSPYKNYQLDFLRKNFIPVQKVKDKIEEEKLPLVIVGGRRNKKTLEYGIKLGRRYVLQELLERRK